ncbi:MAG: Leucyl-tRNA synthetase, partial [uncultured Corynebacteriales bacterium]
DGRPLRLADDPGPMAAGVGEAGPVPRRPARPGRRAPLRAGHVPVPVRRPAHGPRRGVRHRRRHRAALVPAGLRRAAPHRLGLLRPAGGERRDQAELQPGRVDVREHRDPGGLLPSVRDLVRLVPPPAHLRPGVLPLDPVAVPAAARARPGLPQGLPGQLVPEGPDGAGQRAGRRRRLRAVRHAGHQARADPVVLPHHPVRRAPAGRHGAAGGPLARPRADHAAELDRPLPRRPGRLRGGGPRRAGHRVHHPPRHPVRRDVLRGRRRLPAGSGAVRAGATGRLRGLPRAGRPADRDRPAGRGTREDRRPAGPARDQPGQRRAHPDLGRRLRAGRLRHRRDHGGARARPARPGLRPHLRAAGPGRGGHRRARSGGDLDRDVRRRRAGQLRPAGRPAQGGRHRGHRGRAGGEGRRARLAELPAARLAGLPPALLGRADPDRALPRRRRGPGAGRAAAGAAAGAARRGPGAQGRLAAGRRHRLGAHDLPALRWSGRAGHRHDGHLRRLLLVLPAVPVGGPGRRRHRPGGHEALGAGRQLHRRRGARDPAPAVQPVHHQGPARPGARRLRRAVRHAAQPGPGDQPGQVDVQVAGQRRRPGRRAGDARRRRDPADDAVRRSARGGRRLGRRVADRVGQVPGPGLAGRPRRHHGARHRPRRGRRRAAGDHPPRRGRDRLVGRGVPLQRGGRPADGAGQRHPEGDRLGSRRRRPGRPRGRRGGRGDAVAVRAVLRRGHVGRAGPRADGGAGRLARRRSGAAGPGDGDRGRPGRRQGAGPAGRAAGRHRGRAARAGPGRSGRGQGPGRPGDPHGRGASAEAGERRTCL